MSCGTQKSAKIPLPVAKMIWSFNKRRAWKKNPKLINVGPTFIPDYRVVYPNVCPALYVPWTELMTKYLAPLDLYLK